MLLRILKKGYFPPLFLSSVVKFLHAFHRKCKVLATETLTRTKMSYCTPQSMFALGIVFPLLGIIIVALRFRARQLQKAEFGIDDWYFSTKILS